MRTWVAIVATAVATASAMRLLESREVRAAETVVSATRFQLLDQAGNPRGYFGYSGTETTPRLTLCDEAGRCRAILNTDSLSFDDAEPETLAGSIVGINGLVTFDNDGNSTILNAGRLELGDFRALDQTLLTVGKPSLFLRTPKTGKVRFKR